MYQVTAVYQDAEIGYGEGESLDWAAEECALSIVDYPYTTLSAGEFVLIVLNTGARTEINGAACSPFREALALV